MLDVEILKNEVHVKSEIAFFSLNTVCRECTKQNSLKQLNKFEYNSRGPGTPSNPCATRYSTTPLDMHQSYNSPLQ
uniref:Uncharacterized protein n=1 Tax=Arundo donax TaxID=35708 RepID=A0A0A9EI63_ARUDO